MEYVPTTNRYTDTISLGEGSLLCFIDIPYAEGAKKFNSFYKKIGERCIKYCKRGLLSRLSQREGAHTYSYRASCKILKTAEGFAVTLRVCLSDRSTYKTLAEHTETHLWNPRLSSIRLQKESDKHKEYKSL